MAVQNSSDHGAPMDQKAHVATYSGFISLLKIGTIITVIVAALVVFAIAN